MVGLNPAFWRDLQFRFKPLILACVVLSITSTVAFLLVQDSFLTILGVGALLTGLALFVWPDLATLLVIFILYTNAAVIAVNFHGVPYIVGAAVPVLLVIPLTTYLVIRREPLVLDSVVLLLVLFVAIQLASLVFVGHSQRIDRGIDRVLTFVIEGLGLYFLLINTVRTQRTLRNTAWALAIVGLLLGSLSFYQQVTQSFDHDFGGFAQMSNTAFGTGEENLQGEIQQPRLAGPLGDQNRYAQMMLMLAPLALFRMWDERSLLLRILGGVAALVTLIGMGLTFSRGVLIGLAIMLLVMLFLRYVKFYQVLLVVVILFALTQAVPQVGGRLVKLQNLSLTEMLSSDSSQTGLEEADGSTQNRVAQQLTALRMFLDYPILGVGTGFYGVNYHEYAKLVGMKVKNENRESHTLYLGLAAENGLLGLGCYLAMIYLTLRNLTQMRRRWLAANPQLANLAIAFFLAIVGYLGTAIFLHLAYVRFFWLIMGLAGAAYQISQRQEPTQLTPVSAERLGTNDSSPAQVSHRMRTLRRKHNLPTGS